MSALHDLARWYRSHCDDAWEHEFGVKIETLDNPGWELHFDIEKTPLSGLQIPWTSRQDEDEEAWLRYMADGRVVHMYCGPLALEQAVRIFLYELVPQGPQVT